MENLPILDLQQELPSKVAALKISVFFRKLLFETISCRAIVFTTQVLLLMNSPRTF